MNCTYCTGDCAKRGFYKSIQRYRCRSCGKYQQAHYTYSRCTPDKEKMLVTLNNEGVGISSISRIIGMSKAHVINKIRELAKALLKPMINETGKQYEIDEIQTYIGRHNSSYQVYIICAINRDTKQLVDFYVGKRTTENIKKVVSTVLSFSPSKIFTDGLNIYASLIPPALHVRSGYCTNRIERFNLTLRTHLKRLTRKTICFSRSIDILENCLRLYFWGNKKTHASKPN